MINEKGMNQEEQINKTMNSLSGMARAKAPEYALTGIKQRIKHQQNTPLPYPIYTLLGVAATIVLVITFNVICLTTYVDQPQPESTTDVYSPLVSSFNLYANE